MKKLKKLITGLTATFAMCLLFANVVSVQAYNSPHYQKNKVYIDEVENYKGDYVNTTKRRIGLFEMSTISLEFPENAEIKELKSSNKALELAVTNYKAHNGDYHYVWDAAKKSYTDEKFYMGSATIAMYATKAGTYKVTFKVGSTKYTVNVLASNTGIYSKATLGKTKLRLVKTKVKSGELQETVSTMSKVTAKKGKLKFTAGTKYKITGFVVEGVNKSGSDFYKKYKNGKSISLSQGHWYTNKSSDGSYTKPSKKYTYVYISYKDTFTGDTVTYSISKKRGKKEVVKTEKDGITGIKTTEYGPSASMYLWNY